MSVEETQKQPEGEYTADGKPVLEFALPSKKFSYRMQAFEKGAITPAQLRSAMDKLYPKVITG